MSNIQSLELFGCVGSPRCAFRNIGLSVKAIDYVEIDQKAVDSYNQMFIADLTYKTQSVVGYNLKPSILIHGSPCQDFSIAGQQKGADEGSEAALKANPSIDGKMNRTLYKQAGNSMPVPMLESIFRKMFL